MSDEPKDPAPEEASSEPQKPQDSKKKAQKHAKELGGPKGPEPTRSGDWERKGIAVDF